MTTRIREDSFDLYVALGPARSYQTVADRLGVSKRAVTRHAARHRWALRLAEIESKARQRTDEKLVDVVSEMNARHLKTLKVIQGKALETLRAMPLTRAFEAVRALDMSIRSERLIYGEPTDRTATSVEDVIRKEYQRWLGPGEDGEEISDGEQPPPQDAADD